MEGETKAQKAFTVSHRVSKQRKHDSSLAFHPQNLYSAPTTHCWKNVSVSSPEESLVSKKITWMAFD